MSRRERVARRSTPASSRSRRLGRGGSGATFRREDGPTATACVVKLFDADGAATATDEFRRLVGLAHPNIVRVRDIGRAADGRPFVVTRPRRGRRRSTASPASLDDGERRRAFERAARALADALAHLHARGRDARRRVPAPTSASTPTGRAVLLDFGLAGPPRPGAGGAARARSATRRPRRSRARGRAAGNLFGLGATLFEAWTGAAPFGRGLPAVQRMLTARAPSLSSVRAGLRPGVGRARRPAARARGARAADERARSCSASCRARFAATPDARAEADLGVPYPAGYPLEGVFVGRAAERAGHARGARARSPRARRPRPVVAVVGAPGVGPPHAHRARARELALAVDGRASSRDVHLCAARSRLSRPSSAPRAPPRPEQLDGTRVVA